MRPDLGVSTKNNNRSLALASTDPCVVVARVKLEVITYQIDACLAQGQKFRQYTISFNTAKYLNMHNPSTYRA